DRISDVYTPYLSDSIIQLDTHASRVEKKLNIVSLPTDVGVAGAYRCPLGQSAGDLVLARSRMFSLITAIATPNKTRQFKSIRMGTYVTVAFLIYCGC